MSVSKNIPLQDRRVIHVTGQVLGTMKKPFEKILYLMLYELTTSSRIYFHMQRSRKNLRLFIKEHYFQVHNQRVA